MKLNTLHDLFIDQLKDVYNAESQLLKAIPKMSKRASHQELKDALDQHLGETEEQIARLDQIAEKLETRLKGKTCKAMEGLIEEGSEILSMEGESSVIDAGIIAAAQRVEHYEISAYGTLCAYAERLGLEEIADLLASSLEEEKNADQKLTEIAEEVVNEDAASISEGDEDEGDEDYESTSEGTGRGMGVGSMHAKKR